MGRGRGRSGETMGELGKKMGKFGGGEQEKGEMRRGKEYDEEIERD